MIRIARITRGKKLVLLASAVLLIFGLPLSKKPPAVLAAQIGSSTMAPAALHAHYFAAPDGDEKANKGGEITIAQPKVWQYERVNALLDGLLRDVEGVSLSDLTQLDPNKSNAAAIRFVQSALGIAVTYDQAGQVNNSNTLQTFQAKHDSEVRQLNEYNNYMQGLTAQRDSLTQQIFANNRQIVSLQSQQDQGTLSADQANQLKAATDRGTTLNAQLKDVNAMISGAGAPPTLSAPPTVTGTSATAPQLPTPSSLGDLLKSLPDSVQKSLANGLQSPTYPATKQLDAFITLLHERLAREISVMQDDLIRDPNTFAYLVQFDVGLYPAKKSKNHMARVEFDLVNCPGCKVYSLYPGLSSYNVTNYQGSSKRRTFAGNMLTLIGLGISGNYQRQEDALKGSLVQSVYISGFQQDTETAAEKNAKGEPIAQRFGWYYNPAPFDEYVTPGIRSTFAIVTVPMQTVKDDAPKNGDQAFPLTLSVSGTWPPRDKPNELEHKPMERVVKVKLPATKNLIELPSAVANDSQRLHVLRMEYNTVTVKGLEVTGTASSSSLPAPTPSPSPTSAVISSYGCKKGECATVLLTLDVPIDPNLVITVDGNPLRRVRDWRGRATSVLPPVQSLSDIGAQLPGTPVPKSETVASRSLLETDQLEPNSWYAVTSHDLLLTISHDLAGEELFPVIQISDPGKRTLVIPNDLREDVTELIFQGFRLLPSTGDQVFRYIRRSYADGASPSSVKNRNDSPGQGGPFPYSTFLPLFFPSRPTAKFYASVGETGQDLILGFLPSQSRDENKPKYRDFLDTRTMVILEDKDIDLAWSLSCASQGIELICKLPMETIKKSYVDVIKACPSLRDCPSIEPAIEHVRDVVSRIEKAPRAPGFDPSDTRDIVAKLDNYLPFVSNLQAWVWQSDPEGENSFWSPEPAKVGLFPLSNLFTSGGSLDETFRPWHFYGQGTSVNEVAIEECNYACVETAGIQKGLPKICNNQDSAHAEGAPLEIKFLTPIDSPQKQVGLTPKSSGGGCSYVQLPTSALRRPEIVLQIGNPAQHPWTAAIATARLAPEFSEPTVKRFYSQNKDKYTVAAWEIKVPVNRVHCKDKIEFPEGFFPTDFKWLNGANPISDDRKQYVNGDHCTDAWWEEQMAGQIQLYFRLTKETIKTLPSELHLIRTSKTGVEIAVAKLPDLRKLTLPSKLKVESIGESQFALRGRNAGAIDAVAVQNGSFFHTFETGTGTDFALVNAVTEKPPAASRTAGKPGKPRKAAAAAPPAAAPSAAAPASPIPTPSPVARSSAGAKPTPTPNPVGSAQVSNPPVAGSGAANAASKQQKVLLEPGTYALVPLIKDGNNYLPIEVTDEQGKALTFTVPAKKDAAKDNPGTTPDETVTITKTTKKPGPAATPSATPAK